MSDAPEPLAEAFVTVAEQLRGWLDVDEPMVESIGNTLAEHHHCDSQEQARRVLGTVINVLERHADGLRSDARP